MKKAVGLITAMALVLSLPPLTIYRRYLGATVGDQR